MVLITLFLVLFSFNDKDSLTVQYAKEVNKSIQKTLDIDSPHLQKVNFDNGELHSIVSNNKEIGYILVSEVAACNLGGCNAYDQIKSEGGREYFDLLLITDLEGEIRFMKILDYFSDYGYEITSKKYLKKFVGLNTCDFAAQTDNVDAISGATISSYALEGVLEIFCHKLSDNN